MLSAVIPLREQLSKDFLYVRLLRQLRISPVSIVLVAVAVGPVSEAESLCLKLSISKKSNAPTYKVRQHNIGPHHLPVFEQRAAFEHSIALD